MNAPINTAELRFQLDGKPVPFQQGQTVMQAALQAGIDIPHLCYHPKLEPIGSCRLCLVEVQGRKLSACTLTASIGLDVDFATEALFKLRQNLLTLLLEQGKHACNWCEKTGDCRLQDAAARLKIPAVASHPSAQNLQRDDSHPEVILDRSHCILCGICIQASETLDGKNLFGFSGSHSGQYLSVNSPSGLLQDSNISPDDQAVKLCPVGALMVKPQPVSFDDGFDTGMGQWG